MIKAVRVFYRKPDEIVWTHTLMGTGVFPTTIEQDLAEIPDKVTSQEEDTEGNIISETKIGGSIGDYACIEEQSPQRASDFLKSDDNKIIGGKLIIGAKRIPPPPTPKRDKLAELEARVAKLEN